MKVKRWSLATAQAGATWAKVLGLLKERDPGGLLSSAFYERIARS